MSSSSGSIKFQQLEKVFQKAIDASISSIDEKKLGEIYSTELTGNNNLDIQGLLIQANVETERKIKIDFQKICLEENVEATLNNISNPIKIEQSLLEVTDSLRLSEIERLNLASSELERKSKVLRTKTAVLKAQIQNEMNAMAEEVREL
jgi:hypothetical protein